MFSENKFKMMVIILILNYLVNYFITGNINPIINSQQIRCYQLMVLVLSEIVLFKAFYR